MKTVPAGLLTSQTRCHCLRVERNDGVIDAFTSTDRDVEVDGLTYRAAAGLIVSNLVSQAALSVDNMEITVLPDDTEYPQVDILAGRWDNAQFRLFECDYTNPALGINLLKRGTTGQADTLRVSNRFEFRGLKQALQQQLGAVTSKTCRYRLGSTAMPFGLCMVDLAPWTSTYTVTAVASRNEFTCAGAGYEVDDLFGDGTVTFNDGSNEGYSGKVKTFAAGVFELLLDMPFAVQVGDEITAIAGCRKRLEDCRDKFDNVLNFGGEPHLPGVDAITKDPEIAA